jgi:hypothetical protein
LKVFAKVGKKFKVVGLGFMLFRLLAGNMLFFSLRTDKMAADTPLARI